MARSGINKREIDKWAKNLVRETNKSLERAQRRNPPRVSAQIEATSSAVPGEVTGYLARLLLWLDDREKQNPGRYIKPDPRQGLVTRRRVPPGFSAWRGRG